MKIIQFDQIEFNQNFNENIDLDKYRGEEYCVEFN
jgi:hypothetical protein